MRTLLIVDDEKNIRLGLRAIIERQYPGSYTYLFAADGEEAMSILEREPVHILITDIRMPGMDGLTLIKGIRERGCTPTPAVLILSGYDDFHYAKEAMKYQVKEYLLKPIVREEMHSALESMEQELREQEHITGRLVAADQHLADLRAAELNYIYVHPGMGHEEIAARCSRVGLDSLEPLYYTGVLRFAGEGSQNVKAVEYLSRYVDGGACLYVEDRDRHLVIVTKQLPLLESLMEHLKGRSSSPYYMGVSLASTAAGQVKESYEQAKQALKYSLFGTGTGSEAAILRYEEVQHRRMQLPIPVEDIRKLANMLGTDRVKEMNALLVGVLDLKRAEQADISYIEGISKQLNELVFDKVFHEYGEESVEILRLYKRVGSIYHYASVHDYFHQVKNLLIALNDYVRNLRAAYVEHREMKRAVAYIQEHYSQDLNMAMVSNHVSLNYSYFSQLFKEYTGQSFVHYLKKVRIEKAKELLQQTDAKVYEIGEQVGFEHAKQFNRVFKELEGISAMEYRGGLQLK